MGFIVVGLSHKTAPVSLRERLMLREEAWPKLLENLAKEKSISEALFLSTCNRIELYLLANQEEGGLEAAKRHLFGADLEMGEDHLYVKREGEAINHFFKVAASLDSMVVGETQISHQVKEAYQLAVRQGTVGKQLHRFVQRAFNIAKRVRTETSIGEHPVSVSYAAVVLAEKIFGSLGGKKVLLIGAGEMGELACEHFQTRGAEIAVTNRTQCKSEELTRKFGGTTIPFAEFQSCLEHFDVILTSITSEHPVLTLDIFKGVMERRKNKALFVIDIAVPRNVEEGVNSLDNLFLYNIDDLKEIVDTNKEARQREVEKGEQLIQQEVEKLLIEMKGDDLGPTIQNLRGKFEVIRRGELDKYSGRLQNFSPEQREVLESCTRAIVKKILHEPIMALKMEAMEEEGNRYGDFLKRLFKLD